MAETRERMGGKPVVFKDAKTVINFKSGFQKKLLCDGLTFSFGNSCQYSCSFCYVAPLMREGGSEEAHFNQVTRRRNGLEILQSQLRDKRFIPKFHNDGPKVIYASPLVDVASNMDLVRETVEACKIILSDTSWHIRLLSKSNLLPKVAEGLEGYCLSGDAKRRVIYGFSTGTLDDGMARAFEEGTAKVSKRIEALHQLQDAGFRTYGMICPSLPQRDYYAFARDCADALRIENCEHVWAEVMNVRGASLARTYKALHDAGYAWEANRLKEVSDKDAWEEYARDTFAGYCLDDRYIGKLRFLQYVTKATREYWETGAETGAVLL